MSKDKDLMGEAWEGVIEGWKDTLLLLLTVISLALALLFTLDLSNELEHHDRMKALRESEAPIEKVW